MKKSIIVLLAVLLGYAGAYACDLIYCRDQTDPCGGSGSTAIGDGCCGFNVAGLPYCCQVTVMKCIGSSTTYETRDAGAGESCIDSPPHSGKNCLALESDATH